MTTASETPPASERSKPPCCTTSNWPSPTMAMIAANGRLPDRAPQVRLEGANKRQARIRARVEMTMVTKLLACGTGNMCRSCGRTIVGLAVWFIPQALSGKNLRRTEQVERVRERPHRVLIGGEAHVAALGHVVEVLDGPSQVGIAVPPRSHRVERVVLQTVLGDDLVPDRLHVGHLL